MTLHNLERGLICFAALLYLQSSVIFYYAIIKQLNIIM